MKRVYEGQVKDEYGDFFNTVKNKFLGKRVNLREMDKFIVSKLDLADSLFIDFERAIEYKSWSYRLGTYPTEGRGFNYLNVDFRVNSDSSVDMYDVVVKVTNIELV